MANGDAASAKGWHTLAGVNDLRQGYDEVNEALDDVAGTFDTGTWPWARLTGKPFGSFTISEDPPSGTPGDNDIWIELI